MDMTTELCLDEKELLSLNNQLFNLIDRSKGEPNKATDSIIKSIIETYNERLSTAHYNGVQLGFALKNAGVL